MYRIIILLLFTFFISDVFTQEKHVVTQVKSVTIYHIGALVERDSDLKFDNGIYDLVFSGVSSKMVLNSFKINNPEVTILNKALLTKLSDEEIQILKDKRNALQKQVELIDVKFEEKGFISDVSELEKMTNFYTDKTVSLRKEIRKIDRKLAENDSLKDDLLKNDGTALLKLTVSVSNKMKKPLHIQYVCGAVGWTPAYDINVASAESDMLEIKFLARTMNQSGEDWENTTFRLSSSFPLDSPNQLPRPESSWVLTPKDNAFGSSSSDRAKQNENSKIDRLEGVTYSDILVPSNLKIREIQGRYTLKSNGSVFILPVKRIQLPAQFFYYGFPSLDPEVYLVASVQEWQEEGLIDGVANISFEGNDVGKSIIRFSDYQHELILPIAKDNSIFLKRSEIANQKYMRETTIGKKQKYTMAYQFEVKNNNSFPIQLMLMDQIPISQTKSADVDIDEISDGEFNVDTGEAQWLIKLQAGEDTKKELLYTVTTEQGYSSFKRKSTAFRTISCPAF